MACVCDLYVRIVCPYPQSRPVRPVSKPACLLAPRSCHGRCWRRAQHGQTLVYPATIRGAHKLSGGAKKTATHPSFNKDFFFFYNIHVSQTSRINIEVWMHFGWHNVCLNGEHKLRGTRVACQPDYGPGFLPLLIWMTP